MPRLLLLVRHSEAVTHAPAGDRERPLTSKGRADAGRMGAFFRASGFVPDLVLVSPARRARDTYDAIVRELPKKPTACLPEGALYNADAGTFLGLLAQADESVKTLLIVGHNPGIAEFARFLVGRESALPSQFPAPCLVAISFLSGTWSDAAAGRGTLSRYANFSNSPDNDPVACKNDGG